MIFCVNIKFTCIHKDNSYSTGHYLISALSYKQLHIKSPKQGGEMIRACAIIRMTTVIRFSKLLRIHIPHHTELKSSVVVYNLIPVRNLPKNSPNFGFEVFPEVAVTT